MAKIAHALDIVCYCVGDNDDGGNQTKIKLRKNLGTADEEDRIGFL